MLARETIDLRVGLGTCVSIDYIFLISQGR